MFIVLIIFLDGGKRGGRVWNSQKKSLFIGDFPLVIEWNKSVIVI